MTARKPAPRPRPRASATQVMLTPGAVFDIHSGEGWLTWMCQGDVAVHYEVHGTAEVAVRVDDEEAQPLAPGTSPLTATTSLQFGYHLGDDSTIRLICVSTSTRRATRSRQRRAVKAASKATGKATRPRARSTSRRAAAPRKAR